MMTFPFCQDRRPAFTPRRWALALALSMAGLGLVAPLDEAMARPAPKGKAVAAKGKAKPAAARAADPRPAMVLAPAPTLHHASGDLQVAATLRDRAQKSTLAWELLEQLTTEIGPRPAGSPNDARAREWAVQQLRRLGFPEVRQEAMPIRAWRRGPASVQVLGAFAQPLVATALGHSVGTPAGGIKAQVVRFASLAEMTRAEPSLLRGKIVFIDMPMARSRSGEGYGEVSQVRSKAAMEAGSRGALAVVIRSVGTDHDRLPHTGTMREDAAGPHIPALALSVPDAEQLTRLLKREPGLQLQLDVSTETNVAAESANVVAELPGKDPSKGWVTIGAHLDSWDLGTGAIDDGAGVAIVMSAAAQIQAHLKATGTQPERGIRVVLFANEENGFEGARHYEQLHGNEPHQLIAESDFGAGKVYQVASRIGDAAQPLMPSLVQVLAPLGVAWGDRDAWSGPDAAFLMNRRQWPTVELRQEGGDYFDWHHTANDTLDKVDAKALAQNVAAWSVMTWLAAQSPVSYARDAQPAGAAVTGASAPAAAAASGAAILPSGSELPAGASGAAAHTPSQSGSQSSSQASAAEPHAGQPLASRHAAAAATHPVTHPVTHQAAHQPARHASAKGKSAAHARGKASASKAVAKGHASRRR